MKNYFLFVAFAALAIRSSAVIISVNNEPGAAADFASLPDAITAAVAGDTIYVYPGTTSYGSVSINKQLVLLGPGHKVNYTTMIPQVGVITMSYGSGGSIIKGLAVTGIFGSDYVTANDVLVSGCRIDAQNPFSFSYLGTFNGWIVEGCVIFNQSNGMGFPGSAGQNWIFRNNIVVHWNASGQWIKYSTNMTVEHNVFIQMNSSNASALGNNNVNLVFNDNIVYYTASNPPATLDESCTNCTFENNITYSPYTSLPEFPGENFDNQNPQFVNVPLTNPSFTYTNDYHLIPGSIGEGAGTDGSDVGVFGGVHSFRPFGWSNTMPRIDFIEVLSGTSPPGGQVQVHLKAYSAGN
ncbi:MAG: hypothetical protein JNM00_02755 [Flavobacteriales bacterium]|nr:hypothetical protein [Flavobacteriales bacterium]